MVDCLKDRIWALHDLLAPRAARRGSGTADRYAGSAARECRHEFWHRSIVRHFILVELHSGAKWVSVLKLIARYHLGEDNLEGRRGEYDIEFLKEILQMYLQLHL